MAYLYQRDVAFADTDAAGIVHFSRLLCYVEEAEHSLLKDLGIPLEGAASGKGGWPRVHVDCDYFSPVGPGDSVEVILIPDAVGSTSVHWSFTILCDGNDVAKGSMKTVRVDADGKATDLSSEWREKFKSV